MSFLDLQGLELLLNRLHSKIQESGSTEVFQEDVNGLVPGPSFIDTYRKKYLRSDGVWFNPPSNYFAVANAISSRDHRILLSEWFELKDGDILSIQFQDKVGERATIDINDSSIKKPIYYRGYPIQNGIIQAGDIATFMYSSSNDFVEASWFDQSDNEEFSVAPMANVMFSGAFHLIAIDRVIQQLIDLDDRLTNLEMHAIQDEE